MIASAGFARHHPRGGVRRKIPPPPPDRPAVPPVTADPHRDPTADPHGEPAEDPAPGGATLALCALLAVGLVGWGGWRLWERSETRAAAERSAARRPVRLGVEFAPTPVPPADGWAGWDADPAGGPGLLVFKLGGRGPAARSGVLEGDVLLRLGGTPVCGGPDPTDPAAAADRVAGLAALLREGFELNAELLRGGTPVAVTLRGDAPPLAPPPPAPNGWAEHAALPADRGLLGVGLLFFEPPRPDRPPGVAVWAVAPGGPADAAGVRVGDRIVAVGGAAVTDAPSYFAAAGSVPAGGSRAVALSRRGEPVDTTVTFAARPDLPPFRDFGSPRL